VDASARPPYHLPHLLLIVVLSLLHLLLAHLGFLVLVARVAVAVDGGSRISSSDMAAAPPSLRGESLTPSLEPSLPGARSNLGIESPIFYNLLLFLPSLLAYVSDLQPFTISLGLLLRFIVIYVMSQMPLRNY
jgi:hypothetical protein